MCIYYAIKLWIKNGGYVIFMFTPKFHVMNVSKQGIWHGTNKGADKKWKTEEIKAESLVRLLTIKVKETK